MTATTLPEHNILLVRHALSTRGADRFCGHTNPPLSDEGRLSTLKMRESLLESGGLPNVWYISDRRRTIESFEILLAGQAAPVVRLEPDLREINFGEFENLTWEELPDDFRNHYEKCYQEPFELEFPGGESYKEICQRVSRFLLESLSVSDEPENIGLIVHEGPAKIILMIVENLPPEAFFSLSIEPAEYRRLKLSASSVINWRRKYLDNQGQA